MRVLYFIFLSMFVATGLLRAQSHTMDISGSCSDGEIFKTNTDVTTIYIKRGQNLVIEFYIKNSNNTISSVTCTQLRRNGVNIKSNGDAGNGELPTSNNKMKLSINNVSTTHEGFYQFSGGTNCSRFIFNLIIVDEPAFAIIDKSAVCHSSSSTNEIRATLQGVNQGVYNYSLYNNGSEVTASRGSVTVTTTTPPSWTNYPISISNTTIPNSSGALSLRLRYTDTKSCVWEKTESLTKHAQAPFSDYAGSSHTHSVTIGDPMIDVALLTATFSPNSINFSSPGFSNFKVERVSAGSSPANSASNIRLLNNSLGQYQYIEPINEGTYVMNFYTDYERCTYKQDFTIKANPRTNTSSGTTFLNQTRSTNSNTTNNTIINENKEACVGDIIKLSFTDNTINSSLFLSVKGDNDSTFFIPLEELNNNTVPNTGEFERPTNNNNTLPTVVASRKLTNSAFYFKDNNSYTIYIKIPSVMVTGEVRMVTSTTAPLSYKSILSVNVNKVILDFFPENYPICSNSEIKFNAIPYSSNNGTFSIQLAALDMTRMSVTNPSFTETDFQNPEPILVNAFQPSANNVLINSYLGFNSSPTNKGGVLAKVTYTYLLKYSTGDPCPVNSDAKKIKYYPILNNNQLTVSLTDVERDTSPSASPYILNTTVVTSPTLITTPANNAVINSLEDLNFSGTWVENILYNSFDYQKFNRAAPLGNYSVNLQVDNHGCMIKGLASLTVFEKGAFEGLRDALCHNIGRVNFKRPISYAYDENIRVSYEIDINNQYIIHGINEIKSYDLTNITVYNADNNLPLASLLANPSVISVMYTNMTNETIEVDFSNILFSGVNNIRVEAEFTNSNMYYTNINGPYLDTQLPTSRDPLIFNQLSSSLVSPYFVSQNCSFNTTTVSFLNLPNVFCEAANTSINISTEPAYRQNVSLNIYRDNAPSNVKSLTNTTLDNNSFTQFTGNRDIENFTIQYIDISIPTCPIEGTYPIQFVKIPELGFTYNGNSTIEICQTANPIELLPNISDLYLSHVAIDSSSGRYMFNPSNTTVGTIPIVLRYENPLYSACNTSGTQDIIVTSSPTTLLAFSSMPPPVNNVISICKNANPVNIEVSYSSMPLDLSAPNVQNNYTFTGIGVVNNQFVPSQIMSGNQTRIEFAYNSIDGCIGRAHLDINLNETPNIELKTVEGDPLPQEICANEENFRVMGSGGNTASTLDAHLFTGKGLYNPNNNSSETATTPSIMYSISTAIQRHNLAPNTVLSFDTLTYTNTNASGCESIYEHIFTIKPLPLLEISMPDVYCANDTITNVILSPLPSSLNTSNYSLTGVGIEHISLDTFRFNPSVHTNNSNGGLVDIKYNAMGNNGCENEIIKTVRVKSLPTVNLGLQSSMCINGDSILLNTSANSSATVSNYTVSGNIIRSYPQINNPNQMDYYVVPSSLNTVGAQRLTILIHSLDTCTNEMYETILIHPKPNVDIVGLTQENYICSNATSFSVSGFPEANVNNGTSSTFNSSLRSANVTSPTIITYINIDNNYIATIHPDEVLNGRRDDLTYVYTDANNCSDTIVKYINFIAPPTINITSIPDSACQVLNDSIPILANVTPSLNSNLQLSGQGIVSDTSGTNWYFKPFAAQRGPQQIVFTASQTVNSVSCQETVSRTIIVNPLPVPSTQSLRNDTVLCNTNPIINLTSTATGISGYSFTGAGVNRTVVLVTDSVPDPSSPSGYTYTTTAQVAYTLNPALTDSTRIRQNLVLTAITTAGCTDNISLSYDVYRAPQTYFQAPDLNNLSTLNTDSIQLCESQGNVIFIGVPGNGSFIRHNTTGQSMSSMTGPVYNPNPSYINSPVTTPIYDTIYYNVVTGNVCHTADTLVIKVNPIPRPTLQFINPSSPIPITHACENDDSLLVVATPTGGSFSGAPVRDGYFYPMYAAPGNNIIQYHYTNPTTQCSHFAEVNMRVSGSPVLNIMADPACQGNSINFRTTLTGLRISNDTITGISWDFGDGTVINVVDSSTVTGNITLANQQHLYNVSNVQNVILTVTNNNACSVSDTLRLVVSPHITLGGLNADPYYRETFTTGVNGWFDEKKGSNASSDLWRWGPLIGTNITSRDATNHVWSTTSHMPYIASSGWVYSPCFDITNLQRPMLSLDYFLDMDNGNDGAVIEYYDPLLTEWLPLGDYNRGLNWYNAEVIGSSPGEQTVAPKGWSHSDNTWKTGRYVLDNLKSNTNLRFRVAFGANAVHGRYLEGFAFDNFFIGNREKNVLLQHFSNMTNAQQMQRIDSLVYAHVYDSRNFPYDLTFMQIHTATDPVYSQHQSIYNYLQYMYTAVANNLVVDGIPKHLDGRERFSEHINIKDYESRILETPYFFIDVEPLQVNTDGSYTYSYTITANDTLLLTNNTGYYVRSAIVEDSVAYNSRDVNKIHSLLRHMRNFDMLYNPLTNEGVRITPSTPYTNTVTTPVINRMSNSSVNANLSVIVWIQKSPLSMTDLLGKEIYQSATNRNIRLYVGVDQITPEDRAHSEMILEAKLYPNPAYSQFTVDFEEPLVEDCTWKLIDMRGVVLQHGKLTEGTTQMQVQTEEYPSGMYSYVIEHPKYHIYKKVILLRP